MKKSQDNPAYTQGTPEWRSLRKTKITATDASVVLKVSPYKTPLQLFNEKLSPTDQLTSITPAMQRGLDLEPMARELFCIKIGITVIPQVMLKDWAMASLDGIDEQGKYLVEIKCPGEVDHSVALSNRIPTKYFPQLQHQMYVCDVSHMYYFSFDGTDGVIVEVGRDDSYIDNMILEEKKFYDMLLSKTPPDPSQGDYIERSDEQWRLTALALKNRRDTIKQLEKEEEDLRDQLIMLSGGLNSRGDGISLCQVQKKGNVDYSKIPELRTLDLEMYRKPATTSWRINVA